jgi:uncharacterized OB-fold protein
MNRFEEELKAGSFVTSECPHCAKIVWPPSDYCNICFRNVVWRKVSSNGKLIEWSKDGDDIFCITEFENSIRVMGKLDTKNTVLKPGQSVKLTKCTLNYKHKFFFRIE